MISLNERLDLMRANSQNRKLRIMIIGLGSVGNYLLDFLLSRKDENIEIFVVGRNRNKLESDVNIARVAAMIRGLYKTTINIISDVDFNDVAALEYVLKEAEPDIIVNSSRAYPGLKYGSISWNTIRAYGLWSPLAVKFIKNIMEAYDNVSCNAVVINTSYSDAVIPWLKSAGKAYPDFGSGNINHLIPRMKFAIGQLYSIPDSWNIDINYATSHFHDVVISKEGQDEGVKQMFVVQYNGQILDVNNDEVLRLCKIPMPIDSKRNMMNASSNYQIIIGILDAVRDRATVKLHCPGVFGEIGGYPVIIDGSSDEVKAYIDESFFSIDDMRNKNRESIYLDGIENVEKGILTYTDELLQKVRDAFGVVIPKNVNYDNANEVADLIINKIIDGKGN